MNVWIPVSERLPEKYGSYLVTWTTSLDVFPTNVFLAIAEYEPSDEYDYENDWFKGEWLFDDDIKNYLDMLEYRVTAWMPLPEPYEGD